MVNKTMSNPKKKENDEKDKIFIYSPFFKKHNLPFTEEKEEFSARWHQLFKKMEAGTWPPYRKILPIPPQKLLPRDAVALIPDFQAQYERGLSKCFRLYLKLTLPFRWIVDICKQPFTIHDYYAVLLVGWTGFIASFILVLVSQQIALFGLSSVLLFAIAQQRSISTSKVYLVFLISLLIVITILYLVAPEILQNWLKEILRET